MSLRRRVVIFSTTTQGIRLRRWVDVFSTTSYCCSHIILCAVRLVFIVTSWYAETYHLLFLRVSVISHAVNKIDELWQHISHKGFQNGTKFGSLIEGALLYITTHIGELWSRGSLGCQNNEGYKKFCNSFLVHRFWEHDEIWHDERHWSSDHLLFWWTLIHFSTAQIFGSGYLAQFSS